MMQRWLQNGCRESPEDLFEIIQSEYQGREPFCCAKEQASHCEKEKKQDALRQLACRRRASCVSIGHKPRRRGCDAQGGATPGPPREPSKSKGDTVR